MRTGRRRAAPPGRDTLAGSTLPAAALETVLDPPVPAPLPAAAMPDVATAMHAGAKLLRIEQGLHLLFVAPIEGIAGGALGMSLPAVQIAALAVGGRPAVEIAGTQPAGAWLGAEGGTVVLKAPSGGGLILVTAYALPDEIGSPLELKLYPIDGESPVPVPRVARRPVPIEIIAHIEREGDRRASGDGRIGVPGSGRRLEGISIRALEAIAPAELEYRVYGPDGREVPWVANGVFCGSRGRGLALTGFAVRLAPHLRRQYDVVYRGWFFQGGAVGPIRNGEPCLSPISNDPLEAVGVGIIAR